MTIVEIILKKWGNNGSSIFFHCSDFIEFFDKTDITTLKNNNREMELAGNSNVGKTIIRASPTNFILFKFYFTSIHNYCIIPLNRRMIGRASDFVTSFRKQEAEEERIFRSPGHKRVSSGAWISEFHQSIQFRVHAPRNALLARVRRLLLNSAIVFFKCASTI